MKCASGGLEFATFSAALHKQACLLCGNVFALQT
jgi:ribosomal protein S27E